MKKSGPRILLVEDRLDSQHVTAKALRESGHRIWTAATMAQAIKLCSSQTFTLLIGDAGLDGSGYELMQALTLMYKIEGIVLTGHGNTSGNEERVATGYSAHFIKPVALTVLIGLVAKVLADSGLG